MNDPRIGVIGANGEIVERPTQTLSGKRATRPYAAMTKLDATHFVVQDSGVHTPRDFDANAVIDGLRALVAPARTSRRVEQKVSDGSES